jgi:glycolate oxidase FAD binding subunit
VLAVFNSLNKAKSFSDRVLNSKLLPTSLEMLNSNALGLTKNTGLNGGSGNWFVAAGLEGFDEEVEREIKDLKEMAQQESACEFVSLDKEDAAAFWRSFSDCIPIARKQGRAVVKFKGSFLISRYSDVLHAWTSEANHLALTASAGLGLAYAYAFGEPDLDLKSISILGGKFRSAAELHGGSMVVESAPTALKQKLDPWGSPRSDFVLMKRIKEQVDPLNVLNPGRFVGGL